MWFETASPRACTRRATAAHTRRDFERLRQRFGIVCADQHSRNANALQHTDSRPHIRAVRQMAFIVLHMQLRNYRSAAQIAQSQHSGTQRRKRRRAMQIIERRIIVQQRTEDLLALLNVVHGDRAFAVLRIGFRRTLERQADRQRRQLFQPMHHTVRHSVQARLQTSRARYDTAKLPPDRSAKAAVYARIDIKEYPRLFFLLRR